MTAKYPVQYALPDDLRRDRLPRHVAVIMDGNRRWAQQRDLPSIAAYRQGIDSLKQLLRCSQNWGIEALTAYAFSSENCEGPLEEVNALEVLIEGMLHQELANLSDHNVCIRFVGNLDGLPQPLQEAVEHAVTKTTDNPGVRFTLASNYGGRQEIVDACRTIAALVKHGNMVPEDIDEQLFGRHLYTAELCDPDLLIRTSGEMRISNFLLWQLAYAELFVTETLWPDFGLSEFHQAIAAYQQRDRRFGRV
ncbi:MAG: polyprenyl diphosphate synthase [Cyanobacteria bacterium P01_A01_bin.123]